MYKIFRMVNTVTKDKKEGSKMRRKRKNHLKKVLLIYVSILLALIITFIVVSITYNNKIKEATKQSLIATQRANDIIIDNEVLEDVSTQIGKTIEDSIEEGINEVMSEDKNTRVDKDNKELENETNTEETYIETVNEEPVKELEFIYPVEGEIIKEFAMDNLVFSETLQEWIVHKGIDIKAQRTTVVRAAEEGIVQAIKTDPRYGLTVIIEHRDGYKTLYSNLLTSEFVKEGEEVDKGQTIGTVGNSAPFEIADEPHLHFEMFKDEQNVNPQLYLK